MTLSIKDPRYDGDSRIVIHTRPRAEEWYLYANGRTTEAGSYSDMIRILGLMGIDSPEKKKFEDALKEERFNKVRTIYTARMLLKDDPVYTLPESPPDRAGEIKRGDWDDVYHSCIGGLFR